MNITPELEKVFSQKNVRVASILAADILFVNIALLASILIHFEGQRSILTFVEANIWTLAGSTFLTIIVFHIFALYDSIWEYASVEELFKIFIAVTCAAFVNVGVFMLSNIDFFAGIFVMTYFFELVLIGGNRFKYRLLRLLTQKNLLAHEVSKRTIIVGSGSTASHIASEIKLHPRRYGKLIGFIDDDISKKGSYISGVKILGSREEILIIWKRFRVSEIILAIPTASQQDIKNILDICKLTNAKVTIVPGIVEILDGKVTMQKARNVKIEDLLGRAEVNLNVDEIANSIKNSVVMVTGGGGSIGSELCRQIVKFAPAKLIAIDIYENNLYELQFELHSLKSDVTELEFLIASTRERSTIFELVRVKKPDIVFHAAAHKHVPLMETCPKEAVKNNVFGTLHVAEAAHKHKIKHFVLISTDKAVNPSSVMGATKRIAEMIVESMSKISETKFVAVRFGNVLGSHGSVIPLFERQIKEGGPVTVTHKDVVRYFMTIPEAAQLVIQAFALARGGEIFELDMGEPIKIHDMAIDLIKLSGLKPFEDIDIVITGLRPGEKLREELLTSEEGLTKTAHNKIFVVAPAHNDFFELRSALKELEMKLKISLNEDVYAMLLGLVPSFKPTKNSESTNFDRNYEEIHNENILLPT